MKALSEIPIEQRPHLLKIVSLHDAMADCSCGGWHYAYAGQKTRQEIRSEWRKHIRRFNRTNEHPKAYMCCTSEEHSPFDEYGNFKR